MYLYTYIHTYIYRYAYVFIYIYTYIHIHVHTSYIYITLLYFEANIQPIIMRKANDSLQSALQMQGHLANVLMALLAYIESLSRIPLALTTAVFVRQASLARAMPKGVWTIALHHAHGLRGLPNTLYFLPIQRSRALYPSQLHALPAAAASRRRRMLPTVGEQCHEGRTSFSAVKNLASPRWWTGTPT